MLSRFDAFVDPADDTSTLEGHLEHLIGYQMVSTDVVVGNSLTVA